MGIKICDNINNIDIFLTSLICVGRENTFWFTNPTTVQYSTVHTHARTRTRTHTHTHSWLVFILF